MLVCDQETLERAIFVLADADWIDEQHAREIILRLDNSGLFIREERPDPEAPTRPPYGTLESLNQGLYEFYDQQSALQDKVQELFEEWRTALRHFQPVFTTIQLAMEAQRADSTVGDLQPNG